MNRLRLTVFIVTVGCVVSGSPADLVTLTSPNGGETFRVGDTLHIQWVADTSVVRSVYILLSTDDGLTWLMTVDDAVRRTGAGWGNYAFAIPSSLISISGTEISLVSDSCRICVADYNDPATNRDESDMVFSIAARTQVVQPVVRRSSANAGTRMCFAGRSLRGGRIGLLGAGFFDVRGRSLLGQAEPDSPLLSTPAVREYRTKDNPEFDHVE